MATVNPTTQLLKHPLWLVGFRPFFLLAIFSGIIFPIIWVLNFGGRLPLPNQMLTSTQWHAHEMFFGFGLAILGGFLLTATKNWVKIRGYHGGSLVFLTIAWFFERLGMSFGGQWPKPLFFLSNYLFLGSLVLMLIRSLIQHRQEDFYRDNVFFILSLPCFLISKGLILHQATFDLGVAMTIALFRVAFLVMLERTLTQFVMSVFKRQILRRRVLDLSIKTLALGLVFESLVENFVPFDIPFLSSGVLQVALAFLLGYRFIFWMPKLIFSRIDLAVMGLGYVLLTVQLLFEFFSRHFHFDLVGSISTHLFTFGVMGLIIPAMIVRIANGHTGRPVAFNFKDKLALWAMILGLTIRIVFSQIFPERYYIVISLAALCWVICFSILGIQYLPYLLKPRIDGREC
ncbi:MAG: NnrS family protein [Bdellovibrionaceae bacterium]|nr:NnrS family protein [Pseudobdellovibrionaceae bacterium]